MHKINVALVHHSMGQQKKSILIRMQSVFIQLQGQLVIIDGRAAIDGCHLTKKYPTSLPASLESDDRMTGAQPAEQTKSDDQSLRKECAS